MTKNSNITVVRNGIEKYFEAPVDMGLNLMEFLKATEHHEIEGICGGMALCATCHVLVLEHEGLLNDATDDELNMLESLPHVHSNSRLACQIKLTEQLEKLKIELV